MYLICNHRVFSTHDSCNTYRLFAVTNHKNRIVHLSFLTVKCNKFLTLCSAAYNNFFSFNMVKIICVHWLTILFHNIICNIYQVINGTDSVFRKVSLHPFWRRSDFYIFYNSCTITCAKFRILYCNLNIIRSIFIVSCFLYFRRAEFLIESSGCLSCDSENPVTVYTIGSNFILNHCVVKIKSLHCTCSHNCIFRENINSVFRSFRVHFPCTSQLFNRAHHAVGIDSSQFSFFDFYTAGSRFSIVASCHTSSVKDNRNFISLFYVWSSCHNLYSLISYIYLADNKFIRIRVTLDFFNLSDYDFFKICVKLYISFYFCTGQCHCICILLSCHIKLRNIFFNP